MFFKHIFRYLLAYLALNICLVSFAGKIHDPVSLNIKLLRGPDFTGIPVFRIHLTIANRTDEEIVFNTTMRRIINDYTGSEETEKFSINRKYFFNKKYPINICEWEYLVNNTKYTPQYVTLPPNADTSFVLKIFGCIYPNDFEEIKLLLVQFNKRIIYGRIGFQLEYENVDTTNNAWCGKLKSNFDYANIFFTQKYRR